MTTKIVNILILSIIVVSHCACDKLVDVPGPATSINQANIYDDDNTAASVLTGLYAKLSNEAMTSRVTLLAGLSADEFKLNETLADQKLSAYYRNNLNSQVAGFEFWNKYYPDLYVVNAVLEGANNSTKLKQVIKQRILGEAYFMRAFYLFYLVNLYGDIPLITSTDYKVNAVMPRTDKKLVWKQIIYDLQEAKSLLSDDYLTATLTQQTSEKVRPTKAAAIALLARTFLYVEDWKNAEIQASLLIDNSIFHLEPLDDVFKKNNSEAIWQLQPVSLGNSTEGSFFVIDQSISNEGIENKSVFLNPTILDDFEEGDQRKIQWINSVTVGGITYYFSYKYKLGNNPNLPVQEYSTIFRLGEQYLIRAEARIHLGQIAKGVDDLNVLRARASDQNQSNPQLAMLSNSLNLESALKSVEHERRIELFTEWGHRWLDLKRTGRADLVMPQALLKKTQSGIWKSYQQFYPIDINELRLGSNLLQTPGY